jgi:hypothetical protein
LRATPLTRLRTRADTDFLRGLSMRAGSLPESGSCFTVNRFACWRVRFLSASCGSKCTVVRPIFVKGTTLTKQWFVQRWKSEPHENENWKYRTLYRKGRSEHLLATGIYTSMNDSPIWYIKFMSCYLARLASSASRSARLAILSAFNLSISSRIPLWSLGILWNSHESVIKRIIQDFQTWTVRSIAGNSLFRYCQTRCEIYCENERNQMYGHDFFFVPLWVSKMNQGYYWDEEINWKLEYLEIRSSHLNVVSKWRLEGNTGTSGPTRVIHSPHSRHW